MTGLLLEEQKKIVTKNMMVNFARSCVKTMGILEDNEDLSNWHLPYYLLASTVLELCAKIILFKRMEQDNNIEEIKNKLKKYGHDLSHLYSDELINTTLSSLVGIRQVKTEKDRGIFCHDFCMKGEVEPIHIYDAESLKYGLMTGKENYGFAAYQTSRLFKLCEDVFAITCTT